MKRILFVDDEPKILMALRRSLRSFRKEWEMVFVESGAAALEQYASSPFDVVVSDARMPGMVGSQLLSEVKRLYPDSIRMILSGQCSRKSVTDCVAVAHQFFNKPCEPEILKSSVQKVWKMRNSFHDKSTREAFSCIQKLPSQAFSYDQLADAIALPNPSLDRVGEIIARDIGMTAKVVQLVSSGFFGSPQHVKNALQAVHLLGLETITILFSSAVAFHSCSGGNQEEDLRILTDHSFSVATAAKQIAKTLTDDPEIVGDAYLAGVLHEVATLALFEYGNLNFQKKNLDSNCNELDSLQNIVDYLSQLYLDPGGYLAALWAMPNSVVQAIAYHRMPSNCTEGSSIPLVAVHVADALIEPCWSTKGGSNYSLETDFIESRGFANQMDNWSNICQRATTSGASLC